MPQQSPDYTFPPSNRFMAHCALPEISGVGRNNEQASLRSILAGFKCTLHSSPTVMTVLITGIVICKLLGPQQQSAEV